MSKIKLMFSNAVYMFKVIWNFSKSLFFGKMLLAILNGVIAPLIAYILKILVEKITVFDWNSTLAVIGIIAAVNLTNGVLQAYINRKLGITGDLFRNHLMFEFNSKVVNMDYEILFEPDIEGAGFQNNTGRKSNKIFRHSFFLYILCYIIGFNYISAVLFFMVGIFDYAWFKLNKNIYCHSR